MSFLNPISPIQVGGQSSVSRTSTFGTTFSNSVVGGFMQVNYLSDLIYTIPTGTTGNIEYSGNTIPINFIKGTGSAWSPDVLTLNSDNLSSGRRKIGMLVYVKEQDQTYQYNIDNYDSLWSASTASTGTVVISDFGTTVNNSTAAGQNFINAWTGSTIEGVNGVSRETANWRKYYRTQQFINNLSTGLFYFTGITITSLTTFSVSPVKGWVVDNEVDTMNPIITYVEYSGQTGLTTPYLSSSTITYVSLTSGGTITLSPTEPSPENQRKNIYLGKLGHANKASLIQVFNEPDFVQSPTSQLRDMFYPIKLINSGVYPSTNGANLQFNTSSGNLFGLGINYINNLYSPNDLTVSGQSPATFQYRTQTGGTSGNVTLIDPTNYDNGGVITLVGGGTNRSTNQRIFLTQNGTIRVQYGQQIYNDLPEAIAAANTESFVTFSNFRDNAVLIGILSVRHTATNLSSTSQARFLLASKFGETIGASGGISTTTLQQAYNNSSTPEIVTDGTLGAVSIKNGTGNADNVTNLLEGQNTAGSITSFIRADGLISGSSFTTQSFTANSNGLTATTVSATTYLNLPSQSGTGVSTLSYSQTTGILTLTKNDTTTLTAGTFTYLTGASYSNNVVTLTNNLSSNTTLTINTLTGLTINGVLTVTGNTSLQGLTATTVSATTYQNLPLRVSGTGTQDYVTKWNSTGNGISNSQIYDTGGFIGIATTTQSYGEKMSIYTNNKGIRVDSLYINKTSNGSLSFAVGNYGSWGTGGLEIAIGDKGPLVNSVGNNNIAIGRSALSSNVGGSRNIAIGGGGALSMNDSGSRNIAIGYFAMENNYDGNTNVAIGDLNLQQNTSGSNNTAVGYTSMANNTDGTWNVAVGVGALNANNSGSFNTMIGIAAGNSSLTDRNTMIGSNAGTNTTSGDENTIIGSSSFISNTTGRGNTAIGTYSLYSTDGGDGNVTIGHNAGFSNTTGGYNVIIGTEAAYNNDGSNNIFIGYNVAVGDTASSNKLNIGDTIFGDLSTKIIGINKSNPTSTLDVNGTFTVSSAMTAGDIVTIIGNKGSVITNGGTTTAFMTFSGSNTVGGTGYTDFIRVTNTAAGATTPSKTFRISNSGGFEIVNNGYTAQILSITDSGIMAVGGGNIATSTSQDATSNYLTFNNNNTQIYDDGNTHIHSRGSGQSMWINSNNGQINIGAQSPTSTGNIASAIAFATGTVNGYVTINTGRTVTTSVAYGYLTTAGAGTYTGGSQTISISLYANNRIWGQEIDAFSDERMKNIEGEISLDDGIKLVKNLKPIKYTWKEGDDRGIKAGYSAQQVIKSGFDHLIGLIPTEGLEETIDDDGFLSPKDTQFAMNYDQVTPYHGVVIKHLLEKIEQLENRIKDLENK